MTKTPLLLSLIVSCAALIPLPRASAIVHFWEISQVYTNADGSVQYIELWVCCSGENITQGVQVVTHQDGGQNEQRFTIPANLPFQTANKHLLLATGPISGVEPDFTIPAGFVPFDFSSGGTVDISDWAWAGNPNRVDYGFIPTDGLRSIDGHGAVRDPATVTNFAGNTATVTPPPPPEPPAVPHITTLAFTAGAFSLSFTTETGRTYTVEYVDELGDEWEFLEAVEGSGGAATVSDPEPGASQRFYRVTVQ